MKRSVIITIGSIVGIVIIAGITYLGINWSQWGPLARIIAILFPMLICFGTGIQMFFSGEHKKQSIVFIIVGSLLFPIFLSVAFKELELFAKPFNDNFGLTVSFLTLALYLGLSNIFRFPVWAFLYQCVGLFTYYYFLKVLGVESLLKEPTMAWLFLVPGIIYILLSLMYDHQKKLNEAHYSYALGTLVLVFSFFRLFAETARNEHLAWLLIICAFACFGFGVWLELSRQEKYCHAPYLIGAALTFFSLLRLGFDGTLINSFTGSTGFDQDVAGWSSIIVGVIYLCIAWILPKLKQFQIKVPIILKEFFNFVGPLFILGSIFYLGLKGEKIMYESLLFLTSLGFIFGSIPKLSRQFLYIGTVFLVIYIFSIGGEYFQNSVGWPITLFIAGLASMGIGVAIEKVRKKYFAAGKTK